MTANTKSHCLSTKRTLIFAGLAAGVLSSCTTNIGEINIPNAMVNVSTDVDVNAVVPGQVVPVTMTVENVVLVEPAMQPPADQADKAGHVRVYMDDTTSKELLITAMASFNVTVPADTKPGKHKLICRFHKHDGTPTTTRKVIDINVSVMVAGDGGVSVDVNTSTSTGGATGSGGTPGTTGTGGAPSTTGTGGAGGSTI